MAAPPVISANLGFLYSELSLCDRIEAARADGFDAVEMHYPYETPARDVRRALRETGLPCICINTARGDTEKGDFGLCALAGREADARAAIAEALAYAAEIGARHVHVMAGKADPGDVSASDIFVRNLRHACALAARGDTGILIEPINRRDMPGYFLCDFTLAREILTVLADSRAGMMLDLYHAAAMGLDGPSLFAAHTDHIRHVQFAAFPSRNEPDHGAFDVAAAIRAIRRAGYGGAFGAEYRPRMATRDGLDWLAALKRSLSAV